MNVTSFNTISSDFDETTGMHSKGVSVGVDLNQKLAPRPNSTFFMKFEGDAMNGAGINDGDVLVVDRSLSPRKGRLIVAKLDGQMIVRQIDYSRGMTILNSPDPDIKSMKVDDESKFELFGVVTFTISSRT